MKTTKSARHLVVGDKLFSTGGKTFEVTSTVQKGTRIIVLFNGDEEIDFDPWCQLKVEAAHVRVKSSAGSKVGLGVREADCIRKMSDGNDYKDSYDGKGNEDGCAGSGGCQQS